MVDINNNNSPNRKRSYEV